MLAEILSIGGQSLSAQKSDRGISPKKLNTQDKNEVIDIMAIIADTQGRDQFFHNLIEETTLPENWKDDARTFPTPRRTVRRIARDIVKWAEGKGPFTPEEGVASLTVRLGGHGEHPVPAAPGVHARGPDRCR